MSFLDRFKKTAHRSVIEAKREVLARLRPGKEENLRRLKERGESIDTFRFRDATPADVPALAQLHVTAWSATYPGTSRPPTFAIREWQWRKAFAEENDGSWFCFVIEKPGGALVGFAKGRRSDHPDYGGELNKIYLLPEYYRLGLGRRLVGHVARRFMARGITSMWLCGEPDNPSRAFHEAIGGQNLTDDDGGTNYGNFGWKDLRALAEICPV